MAFTPLNALNAFVAVARRTSYARAAEDMGVSTSALSQSVRQLEARLGVTLLARTSRSVALTEAGQRLLADAGPAVDQALDSLKAVSAKKGEITGRIRLTVPGASVAIVLATLIPRFVARYPKVEVDVRVEDSLVDAVAGGFDAGIRLMESIDRDMVHVRLTAPTRLVMVASPAYLDRRGTPQKPTDLLEHDCICLRWAKEGNPWAWELARGKNTWRVPVRGPVTTNDLELLRTMAVAGVGIGYALEPTVAKEIARGQLRTVLEAFSPAVPGLFLYFPSRAQVSPALKAFVELARESARTTNAKRKSAST